MPRRLTLTLLHAAVLGTFCTFLSLLLAHELVVLPRPPPPLGGSSSSFSLVSLQLRNGSSSVWFQGFLARFGGSGEALRDRSFQDGMALAPGVGCKAYPNASFPRGAIVAVLKHDNCSDVARVLHAQEGGATAVAILHGPTYEHELGDAAFADSVADAYEPQVQWGNEDDEAKANRVVIPAFELADVPLALVRFNNSSAGALRVYVAVRNNSWTYQPMLFESVTVIVVLYVVTCMLGLVVLTVHVPWFAWWFFKHVLVEWFHSLDTWIALGKTRERRRAIMRTLYTAGGSEGDREGSGGMYDRFALAKHHQHSAQDEELFQAMTEDGLHVPSASEWAIICARVQAQEADRVLPVGGISLRFLVSLPVPRFCTVGEVVLDVFMGDTARLGISYFDFLRTTPGLREFVTLDARGVAFVSYVPSTPWTVFLDALVDGKAEDRFVWVDAVMLNLHHRGSGTWWGGLLRVDEESKEAAPTIKDVMCQCTSSVDVVAHPLGNPSALRSPSCVVEVTTAVQHARPVTLRVFSEEENAAFEGLVEPFKMAASSVTLDAVSQMRKRRRWPHPGVGGGSWWWCWSHDQARQRERAERVQAQLAAWGPDVVHAAVYPPWEAFVLKLLRDADATARLHASAREYVIGTSREYTDLSLDATWMSSLFQEASFLYELGREAEAREVVQFVNEWKASYSHRQNPLARVESLVARAYDRMVRTLCLRGWKQADVEFDMAVCRDVRVYYALWVGYVLYAAVVLPVHAVLFVLLLLWATFCCDAWAAYFCPLPHFRAAAEDDDDASVSVSGEDEDGDASVSEEGLHLQVGVPAPAPAPTQGGGVWV